MLPIVSAVSPSALPPGIKTALHYAVTAPIYVHCAHDLKLGVPRSAKNCIPFARPFVKPATPNVQSMLHTRIAAGYVRIPVNIALRAAKT